MNEQAVRKMYKYKLKPTTEQERALAVVLRRCCDRCNAALEVRRDAWQKSGVRITLAGPSAYLPDIKAVRPACGDRDIQAFFRRLREGQTPSSPRLQRAARYTSCTYQQVGNEAPVENGFLVLSKIGRRAVRWSRPLEGSPKTVTSAQRRTATLSAAPVRISR